MQKPSCKNTPQYPASCCSPIGQNNTKDFSAQSGGSIGRAVWKWSGKSRFPGAFFALLVNIRRFISLPDLFSLAPTNCPWVSEDALCHAVENQDKLWWHTTKSNLNFTFLTSYSHTVHYRNLHVHHSHVSWSKQNQNWHFTIFSCSSIQTSGMYLGCLIKEVLP